MIKVTLQWFSVLENKFPLIDEKLDQDTYGRVGMLQLKVGDVYYESDNRYGVPQWSSSPNASYHCREGRLLATRLANNRMVDEFLVNVPNNGLVDVSLQWADAYAFGLLNRPLQDQNIGSVDYYIEHLSVEAVGDSISLDDIDMRHEYVSNPRDILDVSTMLTTRGIGEVYDSVYGVNARPGVVTDYEFAAGYNGRENTSIPISGVLMEQLKARYGNPHPRYSMTIDGNARPYKAASWLGNIYTIEGYERDLVNNTTKITIN